LAFAREGVRFTVTLALLLFGFGFSRLTFKP